MGTQLKRLTAPRAWDPEAVQADPARNLEANHVVSMPDSNSREDSGGLLDHGRKNMCGLGSQIGILTGTVLCALNPALWGDDYPAVGSAPGTSWDLNLTLTLPLTGTFPPNPKPASIPNPIFEPPSGMGPHFSPRGRSRDWSRFGPGDVPAPNSNNS